MYGPRTGGPGFWPPSPSLMVGADQHPKPGTVEYTIAARQDPGSTPMLYAYEREYGRAGKYSQSLEIVRAVYEPPARCFYCGTVHLSTLDAYECTQEAIMLELIVAEPEETAFISIAKEKGHYHG